MNRPQFGQPRAGVPTGVSLSAPMGGYETASWDSWGGPANRRSDCAGVFRWDEPCQGWGWWRGGAPGALRRDHSWRDVTCGFEVCGHRSTARGGTRLDIELFNRPAGDCLESPGPGTGPGRGRDAEMLGPRFGLLLVRLAQVWDGRMNIRPRRPPDPRKVGPPPATWGAPALGSSTTAAAGRLGGIAIGHSADGGRWGRRYEGEMARACGLLGFIHSPGHGDYGVPALHARPLPVAAPDAGDRSGRRRTKNS